MARGRRVGRAVAGRRRCALGIPWPCLHEFLAIVTHPRIYAPAISAGGRDGSRSEAWLASPTHVLLSEGPGYWEVLEALLKASKVSGG